jgi:hypothetical protein
MVLFFVVCIFLTACGNDSIKQSDVNNVLITKYVLLHNASNIDSSFNLTINGVSVIGSDKAILAEIISTQSEYPGEPIYRKIWRYIVDNRVHSDPYSPDFWQHSPTLFFNSLGFGYCDDCSALFYRLVTLAGYTARVWGLQGHVVPEVLVNDHWEMYDPDLQVYYKNYNGVVAGVEELVSNPLLITTPFEYVSRAHKNAYSQFVADIYTSTENNHVDPYYYAQKYVAEPEVTINLPPHSTLVFTNASTKITSFLGTEVQSSYLVLQLPKETNELITLPFILYDIIGEGYVHINGQTYDINSAEFKSVLSNKNTFIYEVSVAKANSELNFVYLLNNARYKIGQNNQFIIDGSGKNNIVITE